MKITVFHRKLAELITYYAAGTEDGHYEHLMDELTNTCTEAQWRMVEMTIDIVDGWLADTDKATLWQKEKAEAKREGRPSRYPSVFHQGDPEADDTIIQLSIEYNILAPRSVRKRIRERHRR